MLACKLCDKTYLSCHAHREVVHVTMNGHVLRVHPETLPQEKFNEILDNKEVMDGLREQRRLAPELWEGFFQFVAQRKRERAS